MKSTALPIPVVLFALALACPVFLLAAGLGGSFLPSGTLASAGVLLKLSAFVAAAVLLTVVFSG